jgi:hypothetical protein
VPHSRGQREKQAHGFVRARITLPASS